MIIVGTSLAVSPANTLHFYAKNNQAATVDINPGKTPFSYEIDFSIRQTAVEGPSRLMSILIQANSKYRSCMRPFIIYL
jgi:NAD-dependent deacetylase